MTEADSALLISLIGFFNTGGRILSGAVTDHPRVDALFVSTLALFFGNFQDQGHVQSGLSNFNF